MRCAYEVTQANGKCTTYSLFSSLLASTRLPEPLLGAPDSLPPRALAGVWMPSGVGIPLTIYLGEPRPALPSF